MMGVIPIINENDTISVGVPVAVGVDNEWVSSDAF